MVLIVCGKVYRFVIFIVSEEVNISLFNIWIDRVIIKVLGYCDNLYEFFLGIIEWWKIMVEKNVGK